LKAYLNKERFDGAADEHHEFYRYKKVFSGLRDYTLSKKESKVKNE